MNTIKIKLSLIFCSFLLSYSFAVTTNFDLKKKSQDTLVTIMSFNIRNSNASDGANNWSNRKKWVGELIHFYKPGIVGLQEVLHSQLQDLLVGLPEYNYIGVGRNDGKKKGEYSPIFYDTTSYELLQSATFWLSENTTNPSISWGAATYRIVTWGQFRDKVTDETFFVFNTHFDNRENAREKSAILLLEKVHQIADKSQAIITGDFNSNPKSQAYQILTGSTEKNTGLFDTMKLAKNRYGPDYTFHSFGKVPVEKRERIDYIFISKAVNVSQFVIISEQRGELFPSDHMPLIAKINLKN
ncbi:endonuclease/exonuclease/phosphatase family protein [Yeosuana marina]|uniref:endonuclease/exonuclease/phosphatase family protein n=1 Tax=Yeosuana marina TaxID=1565536 RepID=UPI0030C83892